MVRWRESMQWLGANGVTTFVEVGSGKVLSGLVKRIVDGAETLTVGTPAEIDATVAKLG
jgi:[acyl-carrier-protein] S-malonyltransferase